MNLSPWTKLLLGLCTNILIRKTFVNVSQVDSLKNGIVKLFKENGFTIILEDGDSWGPGARR